MSELDDTTAYGHDQDREPPTNPATSGPDLADRNPDDIDADAEGGTDVNPPTAEERGRVDSGSGAPGVEPGT
ncbi:hypothetical protein [Micromonospora deserti]|uniref:Uncharacterized protein n=1 Tax=Micromonospora deserti TaxID=2070366 RepID=A0A2W2DNY1_9ACTN|nr:hypothetical protein [Micromonospora deserti]PZG02610.1 hypothetical protein C1I99_01815 [Micromonospora deserti]